jgi:DNA adenine methylase
MPINNEPFVIRIQDSFLIEDINGNAKAEKFFTPKIDAPSILKWAGGKKWLSTSIDCLRPKNWDGKYFEPFLGSGSLFFSLCPDKAILSDVNEELITVYKEIKGNPLRVIERLSLYPYEENFYYEMRSKEPKSNVEVAARFIYLNKTCWNGLYRVNQKGKFNTPFGKFENPKICDEEKLLNASKALSIADLSFGDFESIQEKVKPGNFVYLDPPYITGHQNNGFLKYNKHLFSWDDQKRLARMALKLAKTGANVLVSNADHNSVVGLYNKFHYYRIFRKSLIGGKESFRGSIFEAVFSSYPLIG